MGCSALDAVKLVIDPAEPGDGIFKKTFPFIGAAASVDFDDATAKAAIFGGKGLERTRMDSTAAVGSLRAGCPVKGSAMLALLTSALVDWLPTLDVDEAVGSTKDARKKGKRILKIAVEADDGFEDLVVSVGLEEVLEVTSMPFSCAVTVTLSVRFSGVSWRSS